jgi:5'-nucleotidase (lipoprotein e(P4) family)
MKNVAPLKCSWLPAVLAGSLFLTSCASPRGQDHLQAVLWYQHAAEARALYYQAYNIACDRLAALTQNVPGSNKLAVIVDVDETVLNNGPFEAGLIQKGRDFTQPAWEDWTKQCKAERLPGAVEFLNLAVSRNIDVFYITDRSTNEYQATAQNLRAQGFPMVDDKHLLLADDNPGKQKRRNRVENEGYTVIMLFGDSLPDFSTQFDQANSLERAAAVDKAKDEFGRKYIILPNPMYGAWERVLKKDATQAGISKRPDFLNLPPPPSGR